MAGCRLLIRIIFLGQWIYIASRTAPLHYVTSWHKGLGSAFCDTVLSGLILLWQDCPSRYESPRKTSLMETCLLGLAGH